VETELERLEDWFQLRKRNDVAGGQCGCAASSI